MKTKANIPEKTIERLLIYRRELLNLKQEMKTAVFSHQIAQLTGATPVQVRRDFMQIGYFGSSVHGYNVDELINSIGEFVDDVQTQNVALVGVGHLGRAILDYLQGRREKLKITALFDVDPTKVGSVLHGIRCYPTEQIPEIITHENIKVAIVAVPESNAQEVAERLVWAGITGIVNYAPIKLNLPPEVYVENRDMVLAVEKVAFYSRRVNKKEELL
ncbi:MAG: redox-sensing transcriptional repressor Rex [Candidatus Marinimicrobia bacterium]|jgi:redox-sensing transcriptional repressor|nr:redox-sensing transcriptional repressor Rex [Candidatus Neomarinimicrobiota bacterium]